MENQIKLQFKHELNIDENGQLALFRDGKALICMMSKTPFLVATPLQPNGELRYNRCGINCPKFFIQTKDGKNFAIQSCGATTGYEIQESKPELKLVNEV